MNFLLMTLSIFAMVDVTTAIKKQQVKNGTLAKFHWNGKPEVYGDGGKSKRIPGMLHGQIVKIMEIPRSLDGKRINIESLTNPQLTLGVKEHHLEAMELDGLVNRPELNGMTVIRTEDPVIIKGDPPCFRIPVQKISAEGNMDEEPFRVKLDNIKYVSRKVLDECSMKIIESVCVRWSLWDQLLQQNYPISRVIRSMAKVNARKIGELEQELSDSDTSSQDEEDGNGKQKRDPNSRIERMKELGEVFQAFDSSTCPAERERILRNAVQKHRGGNKAGTLAKFHWNGKAVKLSNCEWSDAIPQELDGQIVKILGITRSFNETRVSIQSLTDPELILGVNEHHLEAMILCGLVTRPELNGMTVIRTEDPVIINGDPPCFRIPVQKISAEGTFDGKPILVKLENIKNVANKVVLGHCGDSLLKRFKEENLREDHIISLRDVLIQQTLDYTLPHLMCDSDDEDSDTSSECGSESEEDEDPQKEYQEDDSESVRKGIRKINKVERGIKRFLRKFHDHFQRKIDEQNGMQRE